jgi:hypothetical protein
MYWWLVEFEEMLKNNEGLPQLWSVQRELSVEGWGGKVCKKRDSKKNIPNTTSPSRGISANAPRKARLSLP